MQQQLEEKKKRVLDLFMQNPACSLTILAAKEKLSLTFIYKTLNQNLTEWKELKRKRVYINKGFGGQEQFDEISSEHSNERFSDRNQESQIKSEPHYILNNRISHSKRKWKLVNLVDKLYNNQQQIEGKITSLQKAIQQKQEKLELIDAPEEYQQREDIANIDLGQANHENTYQQNGQENWSQFHQNTYDNQFRNQFNNKSNIRQNKQQNTLDISLKQATIVIESLQQRNFNFTHQNGQFIVSGQQILNAIIESNTTGEIDIPINQEMDNQSEQSLNVKLEE